ncbi:MAG TPA: hypothetical protein VMN36_09940, partial [Verrucomicrobiales bacterium]|nr:hypothetical protein [Verrucomicrobiales bacterium]
YSTRGELLYKWGSAEYPVKFLYNEFGDRIEMHTYRSGTASSWSSAPSIFAAYPSGFNSAGDKTSWVYDDDSALMTQKLDAGNQGASYNYYSGTPLVTTRTWARAGAINTSYSYNYAGEVTSQTYSTSDTPSVTYSYERDGRRTGMVDGAGTWSFTENSAGTTYTEAVSGTGLLSGSTTTATLDAFGRRTALSSTWSTSSMTSVSYTYNSTTGRLEKVTDAGVIPNRSATYTYMAYSDLLQSTQFKDNTTLVTTTTRTYDSQIDRLASIATTQSGSTINRQSFLAYDGNHRKTSVETEDLTKWSYTYNDRGEVTVASRNLSSGTQIWGWGYSYAYDNAGNRTSKSEDIQSVTYTPNAENEYSSVSTNGYYTVRGKSPGGSATVTVDGVGQTVDSQSGSDYFRSQVSASNGSGPVSDQVVIASGGDSGSWRHFHPAAPVAPTYDPDGNLLTDGRWTYTWDAESRLIKMEKSAAAVAAGDENIRLEFDYDGASCGAGGTLSDNRSNSGIDGAVVM